MKVLGIDIDDRLTFDGHVSNMCIKAGRQLNALQRLKGSLDKNSRMVIYKSFIMSNFNDCPLVWMFISKTSLSKLENIQKRALRFVLDDYQSSYTELLQNANVPGIKIMVLRYMAIEMFKLRELTLLTSMQCLHAKNVLMHWVTAQYWWYRKWNWPNTVLNLSKATAQKFGIFCPHHIRPTYR